MFPDQITLYINALKSDRHKASLQYWNNVYEFDMSVIARKIQTQPFLTQPEEKNVMIFYSIIFIQTQKPWL